MSNELGPPSIIIPFLLLITLNLLPLLGGGRANLKTSKEDLVTAFPQDEGSGDADKCLGKVEHNLEQEVKRERPGHDLTVADSLVGENAGDGVVLVQFAHAVLSHILTAEAAGLRVVVSSERHDQHRDDQADCTQDEVQELQGAEVRGTVTFLHVESASSRRLLSHD